MNKETSSRVSSIAAEILNQHTRPANPTPEEYGELFQKARTLAGSALTQDETSVGKIGAHGIHPAPSEFNETDIANDPILHFFHYAHLPPTLQETSRRFFELAFAIIRTIPRNAERSTALRKLLEAKDAAVRANLPAPKLRQPKRDFFTNQPIGEPVETGGHNEDKDGPIPFGD